MRQAPLGISCLVPDSTHVSHDYIEHKCLETCFAQMGPGLPAGPQTAMNLQVQSQRPCVHMHMCVCRLSSCTWLQVIRCRTSKTCCLLSTAPPPDSSLRREVGVGRSVWDQCGKLSSDVPFRKTQSSRGERDC